MSRLSACFLVALLLAGVAFLWFDQDSVDDEAEPPGTVGEDTAADRQPETESAPGLPPESGQVSAPNADEGPPLAREPGETQSPEAPTTKPILARGLVRLEPSMEPLAEARIFVLPVDSHYFGHQPESTRTTVEGRFEVPLDPGAYRLLISHAEGEVALDGPYLVEGEVDWGELLVPAGGYLELRLHYSDSGDPVTQARLFEAAMPGRADRLSELMRAREDAEMVEPGIYRVHGIQVGEHRFRIEVTDSPPKAFHCSIVAGQTTTMDLTLDRGAIVAVLVTTADGEAAHGTVLSLRRLDHLDEKNDATSWSVTCDQGGVAYFEGVVAGRYAIHEGYKSNSEELLEAEILMRTQVEPGRNQFQLRLPPRAEREILVRDAYGPVAGALVTASQADNRYADPISATCDARGRCGLSLTNHRWVIAAARPGGVARKQEFELPNAPPLIEIVLGGVEVSGSLVGAGGETPVSLLAIEEDWMRAYRTGSFAELSSRPWQTVLDTAGETRITTDDEGGFLFRDVPPGWYRVIPQTDGFYPTDPAFVEVADTPIDGIEVPLAAEALLALEVSGLNAEFGEFFLVRAVEEGKSAHFAPPQFVFKNGRIALPGLPPGSYRIQVCKAPVEGGSLLEPEVVHEIPATVDALQETLVHWNAGE